MQHYNQGYDELYHYGVLGMKWGKRKREAANAFQKDVDHKIKQLNKKADDIDPVVQYWKKLQWSKYGGDYFKIAYARSDRPKELADAYNSKAHADAEFIRAKANKLSDPSGSAYLSALATGAAVVPVLSVLGSNSKRSKFAIQGSKKVPILLATGIGTVSVASLVGYSVGKKQQTDTAKEFGIKSVKERLREY